jgi:hypothetical protein
MWFSLQVLNKKYANASVGQQPVNQLLPPRYVVPVVSVKNTSIRLAAFVYGSLHVHIAAMPLSQFS